jgi:hypothetical protein
MRYLIGTSFFYDANNPHKVEMVRLWHQNTIRDGACRIVTIYEGGSIPMSGYNVEQVRLTGDLGHIGSHISGGKNFEFTGWSASMVALAMLAYVDEADFIYKESDCLAFGPYIPRMYRDLGDGDIVFGGKMTSAPWMPCAQSLFLVRHSYIPKFVSSYLAMGSDKSVLGEDKFVRRPGKIRHLSFGVDRMRPIPCNEEVFYVQQLSPQEILNLKQKQLI